MNKELKDRIFEIPENVLKLIQDTFTDLKGKNNSGIQRASNLLLDKKVNYGQLKRIIHDLENIDKIKEKVRYNLYGGDMMLFWGKQFLNGERALIKNRKKSRKNANDVLSMDGIRANSFLKKSNRKFSTKIPTNLIKSKSDKNTISSMKLFEEIKKIIKLINH